MEHTTHGKIRNVLKSISDSEALTLIGLALATNDLMANIAALDKIPDSANTYFFWSSIAIIRETAKVVDLIKHSDFQKQASNHTVIALTELQTELVPFDDGSLTKGVLKPIRDNTFHYNLAKSQQFEHLAETLSMFKEEDDLAILLDPKNQGLLGQRYAFADDFRSQIGNQILSEEKVSRISKIAVLIGALVDSWVSDIVSKEDTSAI